VTRTRKIRAKIKQMRRTVFIFAAGLLSVTLVLTTFASGDDRASRAPGTDEPSSAPPITCNSGIPGGVNCIVSKKELKEARQAYARGLKLSQRQNLEEAYKQFDDATRLVPQNPQFLTARELVKAQLVFNHVQRGNALLLEKSLKQAEGDFRAALDLDPGNEFARQQLEESRRAAAPPLPHGLPSRLADAGEIHVEPKNERATFSFRGDVRSLFAELGAAYGINVQFDESVKTREVRFNLDDVDFFTALKLACKISKNMWSALDAHQVLIADDNQENHKQFDRMSLATFILPPHATTQESTDLVNAMRTMFDLRFITSGQTADTVEVRAPQPILDACTRLLEQLSNARPQVMLDVSVFQISHQFTRDIGTHIPNTFNLYNIPAAALAGLAGQNIQQLINQLIASGGINQAGSTALSGLLAQLGGQGNSIFSQPLATFGGGLTFSGLSLDQLTTALSVNESWARSLSHVTMRATQGNDTTLHIGERYPIQNASYAPIFNSPQIAQVLGNQSYVPPFPSISYEDIGLNLKTKPVVHGDGSVTLQLEMQVRSLTGASANGVPVISNREFNGSINLADGEPAVVAGELDRTDQLSISGIPGLGFVPGLNQIAATNTREEDDDELMIVITPHIVADVNRRTPEIWISEK
jgi:general secretion pathway protein D